MKCTMEELLLMGACLQRYVPEPFGQIARFAMFEEMGAPANPPEDVRKMMSELAERFGWGFEEKDEPKGGE